MIFIFRLIFKGHRLVPGKDLAQYGIVDGATIFLVRKSKSEIEAMMNAQYEKFQSSKDQYLALQGQYFNFFSGMLIHG